MINKHHILQKRRSHEEKRICNSSSNCRGVIYKHECSCSNESRLDKSSIKPGSYPNTINLKNEGVIPVEVLGSSDLDVTKIDPPIVIFGHAKARDTDGKASYKDVNSDGYQDTVFHFRTQETGLSVSDTDAVLSGKTVDGVELEGKDSVRAINPPENLSIEIEPRGCNNKR